jgi:hypothetical protein
MVYFQAAFAGTYPSEFFVAERWVVVPENSVLVRFVLKTSPSEELFEFVFQIFFDGLVKYWCDFRHVNLLPPPRKRIHFVEPDSVVEESYCQ